jgi:ribose transport system permease protein
VTDRRQWLRRNQATLLAYAMAIALFLVTSAFAHGFATWNHTRVLLVQACFIGIVGLGQTFVILGGGVDLSVPWMLNATATLLTLWCHGQAANLVWVLPVLLAMAVIVGLVNGLGVTLLGVSPIIMTLGVNGVLQGALLLITNGGQSPTAPHAIQQLATGNVAGIPIALLVWAAVALIAWLLLSKMSLGRQLYATGTNARVAYLSGVRVGRVTVLSYVISALASALAGVLLAGYVGEAYLGMGDVYLFSSVAAVVIGGASILGGRGHYVGTVAGALILTLLAALLPILNLDPAALQVVYGFAILLTVGLASLRLGGT